MAARCNGSRCNGSNLAEANGGEQWRREVMAATEQPGQKKATASRFQNANHHLAASIYVPWYGQNQQEACAKPAKFTSPLQAGPKSAQTRPKVSPQLTQSCPKVCPKLQCSPKSVHLSRPDVGPGEFRGQPSWFEVISTLV